MIIALMVSACGWQRGAPVSSSADALPYMARHPITLRPLTETLVLPVTPTTVALTGGGAREVQTFARDYLRRGHGSLEILTPSGGANATAAVAVLADLRTALVEAGLDVSQIRALPVAAADGTPQPVTLRYTRMGVRPPQCAHWTEDFAYGWRNTASPNLGCAAQANLAVMVADPHDLVAPRGVDPADAERRSTVLDTYRTGETTVTTRADEESGAVSDVDN